MSDDRKLQELYRQVFTKEGKVKNCGREKCSELIEYLDKKTNTNGKFGNIEQGLLNLERIKRYFQVEQEI